MTGLRGAKAREGGFVLLEALVVLVLLSMTLGLLASMLNFGRRVAERGGMRDRAVSLANGSDAIAAWLASAAPIREIRQGLPGPVLFEGRSDRVSFLSVSSGETQPSGLLAITFGFSSAGTLVFDAMPMAVGERQLPDMTARQVLLDHVVSARLSYFGSPTEGAPEKWYDVWTASVRLPRLVALRAQVDLDRRVSEIDLNYRVFSTEGPERPRI
jgi:hypothetical protein